MRTLTAGQTTVLQSQHYDHHLMLEVMDSEGSWVELSDRVVEMTSSGVTIDQPIEEVTFRLVREYDGGGQSLATLHETSTLNLDSGSNYAPIIELNRRVRAKVATVASGATPSAGDYEYIFEGRIRRTDQARNPISITCRDEGVRLQSAWVREPTEYGETGNGRAIQSVMQDILDDWASGVTLYTPVDPATVFGAAVNVGVYQQDPMPVLEALRALALKIGWVVEYRYDASDAFRLTFYEPDRDKTTPDWTFSADQYTEVSELSLDLEFVRNVIEVRFPDAVSGTQQTARYRGAVSIGQYGDEFWMQIEHGADSPIDSLAEAQAQANAAGSDLEFPDAIQEITVPLFWPVQKGDLLRFTADDLHYTSDQDWAVTGYRHSFRKGHGKTVIRVRGKPAGAYLGWFGRSLVGQDKTPRLINFRDEDLAGGKRFLWERNAYVSEVWVHNKIVDLPEGIDNWPDRDALYDDLLAAANLYDVLSPPAGRARLLQFVPRDSSLAPGPVKRVRVMPGGLTIQVPILIEQPTQNGDLYQYIISIEDPDGIATACYFKAAEGTDEDAFTIPPDGSWTQVPLTSTVTFTANAQPKHTTRIMCAVAYTDESGVTGYVTESHTFDPRHEANVTVDGTFSDSGRFLANVIGDEDTVRSYVTVAVGTDPADPTSAVYNGTINNRTGFVDTGVAVSIGGTVHVKAVGENSNGELGPVTKVTKFKRGVGSASKIIRISHAAFSPRSDSITFVHDAASGYVRAATVGDVTYMVASVPVPEGALITSMTARVFSGSAGSSIGVTLYRVPSGLTIGNVFTSSGGGLATLSTSSISEGTTGNGYSIEVALTPATAAGNSRFYYVELGYTGEAVL